MNWTAQVADKKNAAKIVVLFFALNNEPQMWERLQLRETGVKRKPRKHHASLFG